MESDRFRQNQFIYISLEPGYYKHGEFGVRLGNVLEVIDTEKRHPSGSRFLSFKEVTYVPYEPKLIDRTLLSPQEVCENVTHLIYYQCRWPNS